MVSYLEERIEWYDHNYRMGNALITNQQYDKLEANLYRVDPNANYFNKKSLLLLPSLPKNEIKEFLKGLLTDTRLIIEPKINGCAIAIQYLKGELVKAISRKGDDVTSKIKKIPDVPSNIKIKGLFQIRGELYNPSEHKQPSYSQKQAVGYLRASDSKSDHPVSYTHLTLPTILRV